MRARGTGSALLSGVAFFVLPLVMSGCGEDVQPWRRLDPPAAAPNFTLAQLDGPPVHLADLRGKIVVMEFWATWCGPCQYTMPSLETIGRRYKNRGVVVLLVNLGEDADKVRKHVGKRFTMPILLDQNMNIARRYGVVGIPCLFVIDAQGNLVYRRSGYRGQLEKQLGNALDGLLDAQALAPATVPNEPLPGG